MACSNRSSSSAGSNFAQIVVSGFGSFERVECSLADGGVIAETVVACHDHHRGLRDDRLDRADAVQQAGGALARVRVFEQPFGRSRAALVETCGSFPWPRRGPVPRCVVCVVGERRLADRCQRNNKNKCEKVLHDQAPSLPTSRMLAQWKSVGADAPKPQDLKDFLRVLRASFVLFVPRFCLSPCCSVATFRHFPVKPARCCNPACAPPVGQRVDHAVQFDLPAFRPTPCAGWAFSAMRATLCTTLSSASRSRRASSSSGRVHRHGCDSGCGWARSSGRPGRANGPRRPRERRRSRNGRRR